MTMEIRISGTNPNRAEGESRALLTEITGLVPEVRTKEDTPAGEKRDLATGIAVASLVLAIPGAVLATLDVFDRLRRRRLADKIDAAKEALEAANCTAELQIDGSPSIDVSQTSTDAIVDAIFEAAKKPN